MTEAAEPETTPETRTRPMPMAGPPERPTLEPSDLGDVLPLAEGSAEALLAARLAPALRAEFSFMGGEPESWEKAAAGIVRRLGITSVDVQDTFRLI